MDVAECRRFYAQEIRFVAGIRSPAIVEALARVPREHFLGPGPWRLGSPELRVASAAGAGQMTYVPVEDPCDVYHNVVISVDAALDLNNGQPAALARWIDGLDLAPGERVYHLGCGVGYYTAILAEVVGPAGSVVGCEVEGALAERASGNLSGYPSVAVHAADGATFDPGPCDAMLVNAGVTHPLPLWIDRLNEGGRLVVPVTMTTTATLGMGVMVRISRHGDRYSAGILDQVGIYSCAGARDAALEDAVRNAVTSQRILALRSIRREAHDEDASCVVHVSGACISAEPAT